MSSKTNFKILTLLIAFALFSLPSSQAQEWKKVINIQQCCDALAITQTPNNHFFITGYAVNKTTFNTNTVIAKLSPSGEVLTINELQDSISGGGFFITPTKDNGALIATLDKKIIKTDNDAEKIWSINGSTDFLKELANGDIIWFSLENNLTTNNATLTHTLLSANGIPIWKKETVIPNLLTFSSFEAIGTDYFCHATKIISPTQKEFLHLKFDLLGNLVETKIENLATDLPLAKKWSDESILQYSFGGTNEDLIVRKIKNNNTLWEKKLSSKKDDNPLAIYTVIEDKNHNIVLTGTEINVKAAIAQSNAFVMVIDSAGSIKSFERFGGDFQNDASGIMQSADGDYVICGWHESRIGLGTTNLSSKIRVIKTKAAALSNVIQGKIMLDANGNCATDSLEYVFKNWKVFADNAQKERFYSVSQSDGSFHILAQGDTLTLTPNIVSPYYKETCLPSGVRFNGTTKTLRKDIYVQKTTACPYLLVDMTTRNIRPCAETPIVVRYCNQGSAMAQNAYAILMLDPNLTYVKSSIVGLPQTDGTLRFELGNIAVDYCGQFTITVKSKCDNSLINKTLCNKIHLYPDTPCSSASKQSRVKVDGVCNDSNLNFNIKNVGSEGMNSSKQYIVIEDDVMYMQGNFMLEPNESYLVKVAAKPGKTYRLIAEQTDTILGIIATAAIENCNKQGGASSTGFINQFAQGDDSPFEDIDCKMVTSSLDPNDKQAVPEGFGNEHLITKNTDLEYIIRFQNTGNDTAFSVMIKDTLPSQLDPRTFEAGVSSHPYTVEMSEKGIIQFTFEDIFLPYEKIDAAGSNGFVKFRIKQRRDLPLKTVINNRAALYFDFNDPIMTNTVFHTIGENWLFVIPTKESILATADIKVYPNPFSESTTIEVTTEHKALTLNLFDAAGRLLRQEQFTENILHLERQNLINGFYLYQIKDDLGRVLSNGKLIIQ